MFEIFIIIFFKATAACNYLRKCATIFTNTQLTFTSYDFFVAIHPGLWHMNNSQLDNKNDYYCIIVKSIIVLSIIAMSSMIFVVPCYQQKIACGTVSSSSFIFATKFT